MQRNLHLVDRLKIMAEHEGPIKSIRDRGWTQEDGS